MNKRQIIASLNKIANRLDTLGLYTEANDITQVLSKIAQLDMQKVKDTATDIITKPVKMERELIKKMKGNEDFVPSLSDPDISKYISQSLADISQFEIKINPMNNKGIYLGPNATPDSYSKLKSFLDNSIDALNKAARTFNTSMKGHSSVGTMGIKMPDTAWAVPVSKTRNISEFTEQFAKFVQLQRRVYEKYSSLYPDIKNYLSQLDESLSNFRLWTRPSDKF